MVGPTVAIWVHMMSHSVPREWPDSFITKTFVTQFHGMTMRGRWNLDGARACLELSMPSGEPKFFPVQCFDPEHVDYGRHP